MVCTKHNTYWENSCLGCGTWALVVWENGGQEYDLKNVESGNRQVKISTLAGKYYCGKDVPCCGKDMPPHTCAKPVDNNRYGGDWSSKKFFNWLIVD